MAGAAGIGIGGGLERVGFGLVRLGCRLAVWCRVGLGWWAVGLPTGGFGAGRVCWAAVALPANGFLPDWIVCQADCVAGSVFLRWLAMSFDRVHN